MMMMMMVLFSTMSKVKYKIISEMISESCSFWRPYPIARRVRSQAIKEAVAADERLSCL